MNLSDRVISVIQKNIESKEIVTLESRLTDDLDVDSFGRIMLLNAIEDEFNLTIAEEDIDGLHTVNDIIERLKKYGIS